MRALILWYHKTGKQISQSNFNCFRKSNSQVQNVIVELCTGLFIIIYYYTSIEKGVPVSVFIFPPLSPPKLQRSRFVGNYLCWILNNRVSIKIISIIFFIFQSFFWNYYPNFIILTFGKKDTHFIMANRIVQVH